MKKLRSKGNLLPFIFILGIFYMVIGCKPTFKIQSEHIASIDNRAYKTFKFFNPSNMPASNFAFSDTNKKRIFEAIAEEMKIRSFSSQQDADLIIKVQGGTSQEIEKKSPTFYDPYYNRYNTPYYWARDPYLYDDLSKKTTMIIVDVYDAESDRLLWQGTGSGVLSEKQDQVESSLRKAIADIFMQFPVAPRVQNVSQ